MSVQTDSMATPPTILSFVSDLPNLCSLAGLLASILAIYFAILGIFPAAMIGLVWALFFDWSDGAIARHMNGRTETQRTLGGQLDSLIDVVSFGVCPEIVLLSYGEFGPWFVPGAFCIVAAGVLRLSYFNVFGLVGGSSYQGLSIDSNAVFLASLFFLDGLIDPVVFTSLLYTLIVSLAVLNVAPIRVPKLAGRWYYVIAAFTVTSTVIFAVRLLQARG